MSAVPYMWKNSQGLWNRVWHTTDGEILSSRSIHLDENFQITKWFEEYRPIVPFLQGLKGLIAETGMFDMEKIKSIAITPYVWPATTSLSWHSDSDYLGAFTFYVHHHWKPNWGGEFLTVEGDEYIRKEEKNKIRWRVFNNVEADEMILNKGTGHFVMPKPNRIVFNKGGEHGILHKVAKSTPQAHDRLTLQGFIRPFPVQDGEDE